MGRETLYVANITDDVTEETLQEIFAPFGDVTAIEFTHNERFNVPAANVTLSAEKAANKANQQLNGVDLNGQRLAISYPDLDDDVIERGLSKKARQTAENVCQTLGEDIRKPVRRIHTMVLLCGHAFVNSILEEAIEVYNGEGMLTLDGSRKRSVGGVFFRLALPRMAPPIYQIVHPRGGKLPNHQREDDRIIYHLIKNPHKDDKDYYNQVMRASSNN